MHKLFPSQLDDETVHLVVREHWMRLALKLAAWFIFAAILIAFRRIGADNFPFLFEGQAGIITSLFTDIYILFLLTSLFLVWVLYYLNIQIVTNLRVVDIDQVGLLSHEVSELHIEKIEDVTSQTTGFFGTIFDYGTVYVQTAGATERFEFDNIPHPASVEKLILDLYERNAGSEKRTVPSHL